MSKMIDGVLHLRKGDSESVDVSMKVGTSTVNFAVGDRVTLTVRENPSSETAILTATDLVTQATAGASFTLNISKETMAAATVGKYSGDVQVDFADGTRKTVWPPVDGDDKYSKPEKNWKNVVIEAEVTIP